MTEYEHDPEGTSVICVIKESSEQISRSNRRLDFAAVSVARSKRDVVTTRIRRIRNNAELNVSAASKTLARNTLISSTARHI